jgi:type IV pilus assembly protein PilW
MKCRSAAQDHGNRSSVAGLYHRQTGLSMLEVMVSLALGLLLVIAIGTIYLGSKQTYLLQESSARVQETGRYALEEIGSSLRQAGYADMVAKTAFAGTTINGTNGSGTPDTLTVQYTGMVGDTDCDGDTPVDATGVAAGVLIQNSYNLDTSTLQLRCDGLIAATPGTAGTGSVLVDGVEDFQVLYGIDSDNDESANLYVSTPANWAQVVSARVCILVRSVNLNLIAAKQNYFNCAGALGTATGTSAFTIATDTRLRRSFVATFNLRNRVHNVP